MQTPTIEQQLLMDKSISYRGHVLNEMATMEMVLNLYLSDYFCGNDHQKAYHIQNLVFGDERMNLGAKQQIFAYLAPKVDTEWYNSYKTIRPKHNKKPNFDMNQDLVYTIEQRNIFAHRVVDLDTIPIFGKRNEGDIRFIRFKNEVEPIIYSENDFNLLVRTILNLRIHFLKSIDNTIPPSNSAGSVSSEPPNMK